MGAQFALLTEFNLKKYAIVYIRLLFDNFKLASFKLKCYEKENKKSAKAAVRDSCTLFLLPQLFAGVRKLREVVFCEKLPLPSIVRS